MSLTLYCTETQLDDLLSSFGVQVRTDDEDSGSTDESQIQPVIERATADVNFSLMQRYPLAIIAPSGTAITWVKWATAIIAAVYLCQRRGNDVPETLVEAFDETKAKLKEIADGTMQLVGDSGIVNPQFDDTPTVSNFRFNDWFRLQKIRRTADNSTGGYQPSGNGRKQFNEPNILGGFV